MIQVIVCTRDSEAWLGTFIVAWQRLGTVPLYVVDSHTRDATRAILRLHAVPFIEIQPEAARVEDILWRAASYVTAAWILRIDDDELPSRALLTWMNRTVPDLTADAVYVPRRWAWYASGCACYAQPADFFWHSQRADLVDPQLRLFRPSAVAWRSDIHTPGFDAPTIAYAPSDAYICHFDWLVHNEAARRTKIACYDQQRPGAGTGNAHFYLPEQRPVHDLRLTPFETAEFAMLVEALHATNT